MKSNQGLPLPIRQLNGGGGGGCLLLINLWVLQKAMSFGVPYTMTEASQAGG
jgi:hypothetical protein